MEPDRSCLVVDKDNDIWRWAGTEWVCETESAGGQWEYVTKSFGPVRVFAPIDLTQTGGEVTPEATPLAAGATSPRRFQLLRFIDVSGVTGPGVVVEGVQWTDGTVSVRWLGDHPSTVAWDNVASVLAVHGHEGATVLNWLDGDS